MRMHICTPFPPFTIIPSYVFTYLLITDAVPPLPYPRACGSPAPHRAPAIPVLPPPPSPPIRLPARKPLRLPVPRFPPAPAPSSAPLPATTPRPPRVRRRSSPKGLRRAARCWAWYRGVCLGWGVGCVVVVKWVGSVWVGRVESVGCWVVCVGVGLGFLLSRGTKTYLYGTLLIAAASVFFWVCRMGFLVVDFWYGCRCVLYVV